MHHRPLPEFIFVSLLQGSAAPSRAIMRIAKVQRTRPAAELSWVAPSPRERHQGFPGLSMRITTRLDGVSPARARIIFPAPRTRHFANALERHRAVPKHKLSLSSKETLVRYAMQNGIVEP